MRATALSAALVLLTAACIATRQAGTSATPAAGSPGGQASAAAQQTADPGAQADPLTGTAADAGWLPAGLALAAPVEVDPLDAARLAENELVDLPTRAAPIERWKARRYFCLADFNRDDAIDEEDTRTFLEAFSTREGPFAEFLDLNRDGVVDQSDLDLMLHAAETACDPEAVARNRSISC